MDASDSQRDQQPSSRDPRPQSRIQIPIPLDDNDSRFLLSANFLSSSILQRKSSAHPIAAGSTFEQGISSSSNNTNSPGGPPSRSRNPSDSQQPSSRPSLLPLSTSRRQSGEHNSTNSINHPHTPPRPESVAMESPTTTSPTTISWEDDHRSNGRQSRLFGADTQLSGSGARGNTNDPFVQDQYRRGRQGYDTMNRDPSSRRQSDSRKEDSTNQRGYTRSSESNRNGHGGHSMGGNDNHANNSNGGGSSNNIPSSSFKSMQQSTSSNSIPLGSLREKAGQQQQPQQQLSSPLLASPHQTSVNHRIQNNETMSPHANRHHNNLHQPLRDMDGIVGGNLKRSRSEQTPSPEPRKRPTTFAINDDPSDQQQAQPHSPGNLGSTLTIGRDGGRSRNAQYQLQQALHLGGGGGGAATAESSSSPTRVVNPISSSVSAFGFVRPRSPQPSHHRSSSKRGSRSKSRRRHNDNTLTGHHSSTSNNESSSSSSSGNTSSEDGDDGDGYTGNKAHSIVGLHGSIHDLFMQLEKTRSKYARYSDKAKEASKSIQVLGRKLERRFRDLNEMTTLQQQEHMRQQQQIAQQQQQQQQQQPPSSRQERPLNHRKSSSSISTTTLSSLPMSKSTSARGSTSTSTTADASRIVLDDDDSNESDVVMEQAAAPSRSSFSRAAAAQTITNNTTKGGGSRSTRRRIQTDPDDEILPASLSVVDTLTNTRIKFKPKVFSRKPRGLLMPNEFGGLGMEEVMVTSSLDGIVQFWDMKSQTSMGTISKERLSNPFAEDMCWVGKDVLAIATGSLKESEQRNQMVLVHVNGGGGGGQSSRKTKNTNGTMKINGGLSWSLQGLQESPHDKSGVSIITPFRNSGGGSSSSSALSFFTGGVDKKLFQWNFATESSTAEGLPFLKPTSQRLIHQKHSSGIQALCFSTYHQRLFSGGQDCKLIGWDLQHEQSVEQFREMDMGRINHILQNPQDPHLFLVCHASTQQQLHLYDSRQERQSVLDFGYHSSENLSRYVTPSWHPRGSLVSLGSQAAEGNTTNLSMFGGGGGGGGGNTGGGSTGGGGSSKINLWDIRWKNVGRGAGQSIEVHGKRILKAAFHPNRDLLVSMSTDNSLAFTDYTLNLGTVVN